MAHQMILPDDFREFLQLLADNQVEFLVVGGHAVSFHGYPRFTHDVDLVVMPNLPNAKRLEKVLIDFGFGGLGVSAEDFTRDVTVALGRPPEQIDLMTFVKGVDLEAAWQRRVSGQIDGVGVSFISKADLIANKRAVGRPEDLADIARLER